MQRSSNLLLRKVNDFLSSSEPKAPSGPLPLPDHLIPLPSAEGVSLLAGSRAIGDYIRLMPYFVHQEHPKLCGPATVAICLNALHLFPSWETNEVRPQFTQHNIFTPETEAVRPRKLVEREGMGLTVMAEFVAAHGGKPEIRFAGSESLESFRSTALEVLEDKQRYLAVNYFRPALGQQGKGHTSPLGGYDEETDRFLVLDVSRVHYPPVWVRAEDLFGAMNTHAGPRTRGFAIIGR